MTAYWINSRGQILDIGAEKHITQVIRNPEKFGVTKEYIDARYAEHGEMVGTEGKAREEIMKEVMKKGFIRIRLYKQFWSIQAWDLDRRAYKALEKWAEQAIADPRAGQYMPVRLVSFSAQYQDNSLDISDIYNGKLSESVEPVDGFEPCFVNSINDFNIIRLTFKETLELCQKTR